MCFILIFYISWLGWYYFYLPIHLEVDSVAHKELYDYLNKVK